MAASTNMQQWNPTSSNQETDSQYSADSLRSGGAQSGDIFPSDTANKLFYQCTTFLTGLFNAFAAKGFGTSDASLATLEAQCANFLTTADVKTPMVTVPFNTNLVFDCSTANGFQVTLTSNVSSLTIENATFGQLVSIAFTQGSPGGFTVPWPSNVASPGTILGTSGMTSLQLFQVLGDGKLHPAGPMTVS